MNVVDMHGAMHADFEVAGPLHQRLVQIRPMHRQVRRAVLVLHRLPQGQARQHPSALCATRLQHRGNASLLLERLQHLPTLQNARDIGAELDASAYFAKLLGLLKQLRRPPRTCQRHATRQASNSCTCNQSVFVHT